MISFPACAALVSVMVAQTGDDAGPLRANKSGPREIVLTRVFDASRARVFEALTEPERIKRWFRPRGWSLLELSIDLRPGGAWRYALRRPDGKTMEMRGVYREVVRPARLANTETYDIYALELLVTTTLVEERGRTRWTSTLLYPSPHARDEDYASAVGAATEVYDRLAEYLASQRGSAE